jgi:hypothetical protein
LRQKRIPGAAKILWTNLWVRPSYERNFPAHKELFCGPIALREVIPVDIHEVTKISIEDRRKSSRLRLEPGFCA